MNTRSVVIIIIIIGVAGVAVWLAYGKSTDSQGGEIGLGVGDKAPSFQVETIEGALVGSEDLKGQVVVITSSAAWCSTCVMEARQFSPVHEEFKEKPVTFLTLDIDPRDSKAFIGQFKEENNTPWYYADANGAREMIQGYRLNRFEITYVLDGDGIVRYKDSVITSSEKLREILGLLL